MTVKRSRKIQPANALHSSALHHGLIHLQRARHFLKIAECPVAARAVTRAIKSAEGAERHMRHRLRVTAETLAEGDSHAKGL